MLLGSGYGGDFSGDPFVFTNDEVAGTNNATQVKFYFTDAGLLPPGGSLFAYANGVLLTRTLSYAQSFIFSGSENAFASPGVAPGLDDGIYNPLFGFIVAQYGVAISFNAFDKITVRRVSWGANAPRVLEAEHAVKVDSSEVLPEGTAIIYDDPDLGRVFYGKVVEPDLSYKSGESVLYRCADHYRRFAKEPARRDFADETPPPSVSYGPGVSALRFDKGDSVNDAIRKLVRSVKDETIPGGVQPHATQMPDSVLMVKALDKLGQSIATWLDEILNQTEGGICYIDPTTRALWVRNYYDEPDVTLTVGTYTVVTPSAANPLMVEGNIKRTLNNKYEKVVVEGVGKYERHVDVGVSPIYVALTENPSGVWLSQVRFVFPETNVVGFYYDHNDEVQSGIFIDFEYQINMNPPTGVALVIDEEQLKRIEDVMDPNYGKLYYDHFTLFNNAGTPAFVVANVKLRFTSYDGPLLAEAVASDPKLKGEGTYLVQRPDLFKFYSPGYVELPSTTLETAQDIDPTDEMQDHADLLSARYSTKPDTAGRIAVHIKDLTASITIGSRITNFDARVQNIEVDNVNRNLLLDLSDVPIRREVQEQKDAAVLRSETNRQLNVNTRFGVSDFAPIVKRREGFNRRGRRWPGHDPCDCECDCS